MAGQISREGRPSGHFPLSDILDLPFGRPLSLSNHLKF